LLRDGVFNWPLATDHCPLRLLRDGVFNWPLATGHYFLGAGPVPAFATTMFPEKLLSERSAPASP